MNIDAIIEQATDLKRDINALLTTDAEDLVKEIKQLEANADELLENLNDLKGDLG